jgi:uncharacterized cupredoxin-like copper-binding protein
MVEVRLTEFNIAMPVAIPTGPARFSVTNAGTMEHNFAIAGNSFAKKFDANLMPGKSKTMQADLALGMHTVYCPVDDYKARGMQMELRVAQQRTNEMAPPAHTKASTPTLVPAWRE